MISRYNVSTVYYHTRKSNACLHAGLCSYVHDVYGLIKYLQSCILHNILYIDNVCIIAH